MTILIFNSLLLGVGLAIDAFSVSVANGLAEPNMKLTKGNLMAATFGIFQGVMPLIGWFCVHNIVTYFRAFEKFIPWIALILLAFIGGKMIIESVASIRKKTEENTSREVVLTFGGLMLQAIATSIDALSVGFAISHYNLVEALTSVLIIGVVTYVICLFGVIAGRKAGGRIASKAGIFGGSILIIIGIEIFITGIV